MEPVRGTLAGQLARKLVYAAWTPEEEPRGIVVLVHGYGEHMGRYTYVIQALLARGYAVYTLDHRGHGGSDGLRAHVERFDYFVDDLELLVRKAHEAYPHHPLVMIGHSMGGL